MSRFDEIYRLYQLVRRTGRSCRESYEIAERVYKKRQGQRAYKTYSSFRTVQSRKHKRK